MNTTSASPTTALEPSLWQNPPAEFRPAPFWTWNDKLEADELHRQLGLLAEHGFGGFFPHARVGLRVPYLGEEWFGHIKRCADEAAQLGLKAWIYDEERWPSGYAGGQIAATGLDYAGYGLACAEKDGQRAFEVIRSPGSTWLNGASDPDLLDPDVTAAFLRLTHEAYAKAIGNHFGTTTLGSFMDEPSYVMWGRPDRFELLPWTKNLEALFAKQHGYDLHPHLASLFYDEGDYRKVRLDFYRTVTEQFAASFLKPIHDWCGAHGIASTGHLMMEDSLLHQVRAVGAVMPHYEYLHIPGIDYLGDKLFAPILQKQCASVVHQLGRQRLLCEAFGAAGWQTSLGKLKPVGDLLLALGINLFNQHMALYSLRGCRKYDYPPSSFYQLPGFALYKSFNDYLGRLSWLLAQGTAVRRLLVLHPIQSAWALYSPKNPKPVEELDARFSDLSRRLLEIQRDFDYGDELLLEKYGQVVDGKFVVGQATYDAVVVPAAETWSANTLALLRQFVEQGGRVIAIEPVAQFVDGQPSAELAAFFQNQAVRRVAKPTAAALDKALGPVPRDVRVTDAQGRLVKTLVYMHRVCGDRDIYFLAFPANQQAFPARLELEGEGRVELWDAATGATQPVPSIPRGTGILPVRPGYSALELEIPAQGAHLLVLDRTQPAVSRPAVTVVAAESPLAGAWTVTRLDPNVFVLDRAELKLNQSPWTAPLGLGGISQGISGTVAVPNATDLLALCIAKGVLPRDVPAWVRFRFRVEAAGDGQDFGPASLVIEDPRALSDLEVNGQPVAVTTSDWWLDHGFRKIDLGRQLRPGANQIQARIHWVKPFVTGTLRATPDGVEPDTCFLLGDFHVAWNGRAKVGLEPVRPLPADPAADLTRAGLPFYAGRVRYATTLALPEFDPARRYVLRFPPPNGEGLRLSVNERVVKDLWGSPFAADCTPFLQRGDNSIQIDLYSTLVNTLGSYHHKAPWSDPGHAYANYLLQPFGLGGAPTWRVG